MITKHVKLFQKSQKIVDTILNHRSIEDLAVFYRISKEKAQEEYLRLRQLQTGQALAAPALDLFNGLMYRNIDRNLSETEKNYVKNPDDLQSIANLIRIFN